MKLFALLAVLVFASKKENDAMENPILVENVKRPTSTYIGVHYDKDRARWRTYRLSKRKIFYNGGYKDEETAAHASDTLARKLMANGGRNLKLNFPDDNTEMYAKEKTTSSKYVGLCYKEKLKKWTTRRWSKTEQKVVYNGYFNDEETAARASDTVARKLMANGEQGHRLNFPDNNTEVYPVEITRNSKYFGVSYLKKSNRWIAQRWSKTEKKIFNGTYRNEKTAAHASDTLAKKINRKW